MIKVTYRYVKDGIDRGGKKIPDIPVAWVVLSREEDNLKVVGPCVVDTGFDGGIYANAELALSFEGIPPDGSEWFYGTGNQDIECDTYDVECFLLGEREETFPIGKVTVYVPTRIENLPEETIMGREILNRLTINMNGKKLRVHYAEK
nr:hypothetical protein [Candidatus Freyarchaeota archaeon]